MVTMADEMVAMARHFMSGIAANEETLALEALERVKNAGPGGMFLTDEHTFEHFQSALFLPKLLDRSRYDSWEAGGSQDLYRRSNAEARRILAEHQVTPKTNDKIIEEITAYVANL
jgi:trimethylamine--corrinoid protein Co-methyltransferase